LTNPQNVTGDCLELPPRPPWRRQNVSISRAWRSWQDASGIPGSTPLALRTVHHGDGPPEVNLNRSGNLVPQEHELDPATLYL